MKNTFIRNSFVAPHNLAFSDKVLETSRHRKGARDFSVGFDYEHGAPSYPRDVLTDCSKICFLEPYDDGIPWSEQSFTITASGSVDDQAEVSAGGGSCTSPSGAGVAINGEWEVVGAGYIEVSVVHTNISYPPNSNVSFIHCTVTDAPSAKPVPSENATPTPCESGDCGAFTLNERSELTAATMGGKAFAYDYDNIGNRKTAQEEADVFTYTANALNRPANIVSKLSSTIGGSLKSVVSTFNALNSIKRRAILATSIGTLYNKATLEIVASRCCCRKRNNETVYIKRTIKGNGHNDGIMIDLRGLLISSVTNKKLFNDLVSKMGNALGNVFFEAIVDLNGKTC